MPKGAAFFISFAIGFSLDRWILGFGSPNAAAKYIETWFTAFQLVYQYYDKSLAIIVRTIFRRKRKILRLLFGHFANFFIKYVESLSLHFPWRS